MSAVRAVLLPGVPALLPEYASVRDPVADLRAAASAAVGDLVAAGPDRVVVLSANGAGARVARHLLSEVGQTHRPADGAVTAPGAQDAVLLVANGSACRSEKAPGHLDERAFALDDELARTVVDGAPPPADEALAEELWCFDLPVFRRLHELVEGPADVRYADDPYGVAYWVATWGRLRGVGE